MRLFLLIVLMNLIYTQSWTIDSAYSYISYEGVHPFHSFIGKTNNIDFELNCENDICKLRIATLIDGFDSGNTNRDSNMLYYTQALLYPTISYESKEFDFDGRPVIVQIEVEFGNAASYYRDYFKFQLSYFCVDQTLRSTRSQLRESLV